MKEKFLSGRVVAACVAVLTLAGPAAAQSSSDPVTFGVEVGVNFSGLSFSNLGDFDDDDLSTSSKPGLLAGVYFAKPVATNFLIQPEFLFSQMRYELHEGRAVDSDPSYTINYLEIPILARYNFPGAAQGGYAVLGPAIGILLSAKEKIRSSTIDVKDQGSDTDVGLVIGAGYVFSEGKYAIEARYNRGLKELFKDLDRFDPTTHNKKFSIVFRLQFPRQ